MTIAQNSEKVMVVIDKQMKDFNFQLQMYHGDGDDSVEYFQEDYKLLKEK